MGKAIKGALKVFAVTFLVMTGVGAAMGAFAAGSTIGFTGALIGSMSIVGFSTLAAVSTLVSGLLSKGIEATQGNFGSKISARNPQAHRAIVYGKCRVGGTITHVQTSGTDNNLLTFVVVLAGHPIESLESVKVNDTVLTTTTSGGFKVATNSSFTNSDNDNAFTGGRLLRYRFLNGTQTSADSTITSNSSLGSSDIFTDCAILFMQCVFDSEKFGGGFPRVSAIIKGKKVYDPRTGNTAWSDNPALCVRDYISDTTYGLKATNDEIDDTTGLGGFAAAANTCESDVIPATATTSGSTTNQTFVNITAAATNTLIEAGDKVTGTGISGTVYVVNRRGLRVNLSSAQSIGSGVTLSFSQATYNCNGFTTMGADGAGVLEGLLSSCAGKLSYVNGKFVMFAGATVTPEMTITDDDVLQPLTINTMSAGAESYNCVKAVYVDANQNYVATDTPLYTSLTHLNADTPSGESTANYRKELEIQLPFTTSVTMAQRLQKIQLSHHREKVGVSVVVPIEYIQLQPFDWIYLTNERLGYTNKVFEVLESEVMVIGEKEAPYLGVKLMLKEIQNSVYGFLASDYENPLDESDEDDYGDYSVSAPTSLGLTQQTTSEGAGYKVDVKAAWTNAASDKITSTEIQYKLSTDSDYTSDIVVGKGVSKALIPNVVIGKTYNVRAAHLDVNGVKSDYTSAVNITIADPTSISAPSSFSISSNPISILLNWTNPNNHNLRAVKVYRHTSSFTPSDDTYLVDSITGEPNAVQRFGQGAHHGLSPNTTYYFALRAISNTGVHSSFTSVKTGSFTLDKGTVGIIDLGDVDSAADTKLGGIEANATVGGTLGTNIKDSGSTVLNDRDVRNDDLSIDFTGGTTFRLRKGSGGNIANVDTQTFDKSNVGLSDLASLDSTSSTKLGTIEENATVGAKLGTNFKDSSNNNLGDEDVRNSDLDIDTDGTNLRIKKGSTVINTTTVDKSVVGLGNVTNHAQVKSDLSNLTINSSDLEVSSGSLQAKNALKNSQISISASGGTVTLNNASSTNNTFTKTDVGLGNVTNESKATMFANPTFTGTVAGVSATHVGLGNVTNHAQVKSDLSNLSINSSDLEVSGGNLQAKNALKNSQINIQKAGDGTISLDGGGSDTISVSKSDVGLSNVTNHAQVKSDLSNLSINSSDLEVSGGNLQAKNALKNSQISISSSGGTVTLNNASSTNNTFTKTDVGLADVDNLSATAIRQGTTKSDVGLANVTNESKATMFANPTFTGTVAGVTKSHVGLSNVTNHAQVKTDGSNAPPSLKNSDLVLDLNGTTISLKSADDDSSYDSNTLSKTNVGLSDLNSLDSTANTKLGGIATGATNNGTTVNSSGQITGTLAMASGGSITVNTKMTIDFSNERILVQD